MKTIKESIEWNNVLCNLNESQNEEYQEFLNELNKAYDEGGAAGANEFLKKCSEEGLYEAFFGGVVGFLAGPSVGKIVARALGLEKGVLYDLLTSRLVSAAIGSAIQKELKK